MGTQGSDGRSAVLERTRELVAALKATPSIQRFVVAQDRFQTDSGIQRLLADVQRKAQTFQRAQQDGTVQEEQIQQVREAQARFYDHPLAQEFLQARDAVGTFLQETNRVISEILGFDFGQTVGPAGGAC
jgi:cell fate (sporulation/competence/biofilm development) regulator YlbF (YheA/YmcA/DUF963 family)